MLRAGGKSTVMVAGGRRKVRTTWENGAEMVEEYDVHTDELLLRKRRHKTPIGCMSEWEMDVGQEHSVFNPETNFLAESALNPIFLRKDTAEDFEWRIRNLHYPKTTYLISIDDKDQKIVVRTTNRKYYKRIAVPEMARANIALDKNFLSWSYANGTLVISYEKPQSIIDKDKLGIEDDIRTSKSQRGKEGDVDCKQQ